MENPLVLTGFTSLSLVELTVSKLVWGTALLITAVFVLYSLLLLYHWLRYGERAGVMLLSMAVYFGVSLVFVISLFSSAAVLAA